MKTTTMHDLCLFLHKLFVFREEFIVYTEQMELEAKCLFLFFFFFFFFFSRKY